jgi:hypothetical protein
MFPRDELWIRKVYEPEVMDGSLTRIFKPGDRNYPNPKGFKISEEIKIRVVEIPGNDETNCIPVVKDYYRKATIDSITVTEIASLKSEHFIGASKDIYDTKSLRYNLGLLYNNIPESFNKISIIDITYL